MSTAGTILIVDDEPAFTALVAEILRSYDYTVVEAHSGIAALEIYASAQPDLVLLDVMMPGLDGFATCRRLKQTYGEECAPVIFFTAKSDPEGIAEGFAAGGTDYLLKPFRKSEVRARIRTHLQNRLLIKEQRQLAGQLRAANAAKNRFIGMAAHDMRNPLVSIRGFAEFLIDGTVGELTTKQLALASIVRATSQSMIDTLNELLDVATIASGELKLRLASHHLAGLIATSIALTKIEARKKRARIFFEPPATTPTLPLDGDKIRQVVDNLLSNAIKYSPPGSTITVVIDAPAGAATCSLSVLDQGPGIPESERHKLFKNFGQLSAQPTLNEKSTGLGLAICAKIVEAHGGTIVAENLPTGGSEFRVTLPLSV
ncbi:MAG: hybrid sensor histidine kinase/response regulator [Opitutaceae bacterium]